MIERFAPPAQPTTPLKRQTVAQAAVAALRERILRRAYPEGAKLRQDAIAVELGVSRIPVREALRQLEAEGLVAFVPHRGAVVTGLSISEIEELFELRALIESDLIRRSVPKSTPADFRHAAQLLDQYEVALTSGDLERWGSLNWELHATLYRAAARPRTLATLEHLHRQAERYVRLQLRLTHGESRANIEHRAIVRVAQEGDADEAARLLRAHILGAGQSLVGFLERSQ